MTIKEIKEKLKNKNYLADKTINIDTIKTNKKYTFMCDNGHLFDSYPVNVFESSSHEFSCPICSGRRVTKEYNNINVEEPELK